MRPLPVALPPAFVEAAGGPLLAELLWRRGLRTPAEAGAWLGDVALPSSDLPAVAAGALCLAAAARAGEPVLIQGALNPDGLTATALLLSLSRHLGLSADWQAEEGEPGAVLISTAQLTEVGMPGVCAAWLLARETLAHVQRDPAEADRWLDLVAVGLIAGGAPLVGGARQLCRRGLHWLRLTPSVGLRALLAAAGAQGAPSEEEVAAQIAPRLHAACQEGEADTAVRLLIADDEREAEHLARSVNRCYLAYREQAAPEAPAAIPTSADLEVPLKDVDEALRRGLARAGPFGVGNPPPLLFSPGVQVLSVRPMGQGEHLRLVVRDGDLSFSAIWLGAGRQEVALAPVDLVYHLRRNRHRGQETLELLIHALLPPEVAPPEAEARGPELLDRRGEPPLALREEFGHALIFAEGRPNLPFETVDRYGARPAAQVLFLDLPPSIGVLEEVVALAGASQVICGWPQAALRGEDRFFPALMRRLAEEVDPAGAVRITELAVHLRELEATVEAGLEAMQQSHLLTVLGKEGDLWRVRRREGAVGLRESEALKRARHLLGETRAFRRHFRSAAPAALGTALRFG